LAGRAEAFTRPPALIQGAAGRVDAGIRPGEWASEWGEWGEW